jgi:transposase
VRARAERLGRCKSDNFVAKLQSTKLQPATRTLIAPLERALVLLDGEIASVDARLEKLCSTEPIIEKLTTAPGVGLIVAAAFVSVIDEAKRFQNAHQVESYLGLVPSEDTSGGRDRRRLGSITKQGNPYLRAMLVQGAWGIWRLRDKNDPLKRWGQAVAKRRGKRIAVVAMARRLAGVLWALWRDGSVYDPARVGQATARGLATQAQSIEVQAQAMQRAADKARKRRGKPPVEGSQTRRRPTKSSTPKEAVTPS